MTKIDSQILKLAIPSIISNITVPLLGLADIAITGHLGSKVYIGAISVGGTIFSMIYWIFNFLRFGTGSETSRAYGSHRLDIATLTLVRSLIVGLSIALLLVLLQVPILKFSMLIVDASNEVTYWATEYFNICIYGAFGMLGLWCFTGWFVGMQNTKLPLVILVVQNVVNIVLSLIFVFVLKLEVKGVALGTMCSQLLGLLLCFTLWLKYFGRLKKYIVWKQVFMLSELLKFFKLNSAIFLRTICVVAVTVYFTIAGAKMGDGILAANAVLMQFFMIFTFFIDGFAYSGEALCGKFFGAGNFESLNQTVKSLFKFGWSVGVAFAVVYFFSGGYIVSLLTDQQEVVKIAKVYLIWIWALPMCGVAAFVWDGVFIGLGKTFSMLMCCFWAAVTYFAIWFWFGDSLQNHALWLAFDSYLIVRGLVLWIYSLKVKLK